MPPFELVEALLVKASQRRDRKKSIRKVIFIDVYKAHLYALVGPEDKDYVALPPECGKPNICGLLGFLALRDAACVARVARRIHPAIGKDRVRCRHCVALLLRKKIRWRCMCRAGGWLHP